MGEAERRAVEDDQRQRALMPAGIPAGPSSGVARGIFIVRGLVDRPRP